LKVATKLNHFALKTKLYMRAIQVAFDALRQLGPVRLSA
ncbi:MAG: IS701 family transposase, partial [Anaerolineae bacterium]